MRPATALSFLVPLLLTAACASTAPPEGPSEAERQVAAARAEAEASAAAEERREDAERRREADEPVREKIVVVDPGGKTREPTPRELAAAAEEKRRQPGGEGVKRLTNENLAEVASRGKLTYADVPAVEQETAGEGDEPGDVPSAEECDETCWRRRARELRQAWADTVESIPELEAEVADLRWQFYATDDPWERDSQIKPAWDRALDRLRRAREEAARYAERVDELMQAGRRAGALPGWLREGKELEPEGTAGSERRDPAEPVEPEVVDRTDESVEPKEGQQ